MISFLASNFLDITPKVHTWKAINKMKRQSTAWEIMFENHKSDKGLISKIYKELIPLNSKEANSDFFKMGRDTEYIFFPKKSMKIANIYVKRHSASLIIRKILLKTKNELSTYAS